MQGMRRPGHSANAPQRTESNLRHRDNNCTAQDDELEFDDWWHVDDDVVESDISSFTYHRHQGGLECSACG